MGKEDALKDNQIIEKILFEISRGLIYCEQQNYFFDFVNFTRTSRDLNVMISIILSFDFVNFTRTSI
ncbi:hypothetical protein ACJX0J_039234, partial [Zea mays]